MISKELLSEVLGDDVTQSTLIGDDRIKFRDRLSMQDSGCMINIYELANKCKEWAVSLDDSVYIASVAGEDRQAGFFYNVYFRYKTKKVNLYGDTEPEAIFKACEWIKDKSCKTLQS